MFVGSVGLILATCLVFAIPSEEFEKPDNNNDYDREKKITWRGVMQVYIVEECVCNGNFGLRLLLITVFAYEDI